MENQPKQDGVSRKPDERHKAKFLLIAHVDYKDASNNLLRSTQKIVARCFTRNEGYKFIDEIKYDDEQKEVKAEDGATSFEKVRHGNRCRMNAFRADGTQVYEVIKRFTVVPKENYPLFLNPT